MTVATSEERHFTLVGLLRGPALALALFLPFLTPGCAHHADKSSATFPDPYHEPLISPGAKFSVLPLPVQNTIRAETGGAAISDIARYRTGGQTVYKVWFCNFEFLPPLIVSSDGSVLQQDLTEEMGASADSFATHSGSGHSD
jgi:hypothetical protein